MPLFLISLALLTMVGLFVVLPFSSVIILLMHFALQCPVVFDTYAEFAVFSIRQWWLKMGKELYPNAKELIITADGGGSNSSVSKLWKIELHKLSNEIDIPITVCHFPPGTSKWNKIEHRMFSAISMNWRGRPLINHEVIIKLISYTTNKSGLKIYAELDTKNYEKGIKITDAQLANINILFHQINKKLNYTIFPSSTKNPTES